MMNDRPIRLYTKLTSPPLTSLYVAAALLFCPTTFSTLIPLSYRVAVFFSFMTIVTLLPLAAEAYLRVRHKILSEGETPVRALRMLYVGYAVMLLTAIFILRDAPLFSIVIPLIKGIASLWVVTAISMTLRKATCRDMIFAGGMTAFLAILALACNELWTVVFCAMLLVSGLSATALAHLGRSRLIVSGIDYLLGVGTMLATLYFL